MKEKDVLLMATKHLSSTRPLMRKRDGNRVQKSRPLIVTSPSSKAFDGDAWFIIKRSKGTHKAASPIIADLEERKHHGLEGFACGYTGNENLTSDYVIIRHNTS